MQGRVGEGASQPLSTVVGHRGWERQAFQAVAWGIKRQVMQRQHWQHGKRREGKQGLDCVAFKHAFTCHMYLRAT